MEVLVVREVIRRNQDGSTITYWPDAPVCETLEKFLQWLTFIEEGIASGEIIRETTYVDFPT